MLAKCNHGGSNPSPANLFKCGNKVSKGECRMDERHIPDPVIRPEWKKKKPRGDKGLVKEFVLKRLQEGRLTDKEIAEEAACLYNGSTSVKAVQWYKHHFREKGLLDKDTKHRRKRKYLTEFTYEIIFKREAPPDNVEVVNSIALVEFAQVAVRRYAKMLPKPIDEIVYDVRTAKFWLEKTGRFEVIDQNNYEADPFEYRFDDEEAGTSDDELQSIEDENNEK